MNAQPIEDLSRAAVIARIRTTLRERSGKAWSVTGGKGTAYGWLRVDAPPKRCVWFNVPKVAGVTEPGAQHWTEVRDDTRENGHMSPDDRAELAKLLALDTVSNSGVSIPSSNDYYREFIERAEGKPVTKQATPYWD